MPLTAAAVAEAKGKLVKKYYDAVKLATDKVADQEQLLNVVVEKSGFVSHNLGCTLVQNLCQMQFTVTHTLSILKHSQAFSSILKHSQAFSPVIPHLVS